MNCLYKKLLGCVMARGTFGTQIPSSCLCFQLLVCATSPRILTNFSPSHVKTSFYTDKLRILYHDSASVIVSCFTLLVEGRVIGRYRVTKLSCSKVHCHFGSQADFAISVLWEMSVNTMLPVYVDATFVGRSESES